MLESINFTFNGISSEDKGVCIVNTDGGLYQDIFLPTRNIIEEKSPYNRTPYFMGTELEPISFPIKIFIKEWKDRNNLRDIAQWLFQPQYCPLIFETNKDQIYYVMFTGDSSRVHNGCKDGYLDLNVRANSPFSYSHTRPVDLNVNGVGIININNDGSIPILPRLSITKTNSTGNISIKNTHSNKEFKLTDITLDETIEIDLSLKEIITSLENQGIERYDNHNNIWLELLVGENELIFNGDFDVMMEYELMYLTEDYAIYYV